MNKETILPEIYIATDVEADGPIPGDYSMLSFGMAIVGMDHINFYTELKPISENYIEKALEVSGLDRNKLLEEAPTAEEAMQAVNQWINSLRKIGRPVFLASPAVWDGMFIHWYFMKYLKKSPFGQTGSGIDLRSYWMGKTGCEWVDTQKGKIKYNLNIEGLPHTHHAKEDAIELAKIFEKAIKFSKK
ncbi:exonuclease [Apibacter muscae]|uniref:Exonuclease n=1 Tax=Apibacter muscae TaxID=2509004 RepID=A0A563DBA0_9FLAO|nr:exonuclease [Apibacter muscae]TWP27054.1 exonuclease [Apibacter muscae]